MTSSWPPQCSGDALTQQAAAKLAAWDRNADAKSKGAVLFEEWWVLVSNDPLKLLAKKDNTINFFSPHPKFFFDWDPLKPLDTPRGLDKSNWGPAVAYLKVAAQQVLGAYGALDVAWGDVHKIVLATHDPTFQMTIPILVPDHPQSGADDPFGPVRVIFRFPFQLPAPDGSNHFWAYSGDGYVQLVEFTKEGAKAQALLGYGNASRPFSTHVTDQLPFFEKKMLRPTFRTRAEVESNLAFRETCCN